MRKIELQTIDAIKDLIGKADYDGVYFKSGNMTVEQWHRLAYFHAGGTAHTFGYRRIISVCLFGNEIAIIDPIDGTVRIDDCGWRTATTSSRLRAIKNHFTDAPYKLYQRNHEWVMDYGNKRIEPWPGVDILPLRIKI